VYVLLPLLPAFEGEIGTNTGTAVQAVVHWNYASICRGGRSLLERLAARGLSDCVSVSMLMSLTCAACCHDSPSNEMMHAGFCCFVKCHFPSVTTGPLF